MHKKLYSFLILILFLNCSSTPNNQSILVWKNDQPFITCDQFKSEIDNFISNNNLNLNDISKRIFYELNMATFDRLIINYSFEVMHPLNKFELEGISLFILSIDQDINTVLTELSNSIINNEEKAKHQLGGFSFVLMNRKVIEIDYVNRWIEMHMQEIEEVYKKNKTILISNKINIYIPPFEDIKNIIGLFLFFEKTATSEIREKFLNFIYISVDSYRVQALINQNQIAIDYKEWRKLFDELCAHYKLLDEPGSYF